MLMSADDKRCKTLFEIAGTRFSQLCITKYSKQQINLNRPDDIFGDELDFRQQKVKSKTF